MRDQADIERAIDAHADAVWRACLRYLSFHDAEDVFQETFVRLARSDASFSSDGHLKAWLLRVATNLCKDQLKSARAKTASADAIREEGGADAQALESPDAAGRAVVAPAPFPDPEEEALRTTPALDALATLPERYRELLALVYCEGLSATCAAEVLGIPENTAYTRLARGRRKLKEAYEHG